jgi:hypothetical protein
MDDDTNVDLVDVSPIGSPDHSQITINKEWGGGSHSDDETEDAANIAVDFEYHHGSPRLLPDPQRGLRRLKPLALDASLSPPFLHSPSYPSSIEGTPSPLSYTSDCIDLDSNSPLPPTKFDDDIWFHPCPHILVYVRKIALFNSTPDLHLRS